MRDPVINRIDPNLGQTPTIADRLIKNPILDFDVFGFTHPRMFAAVTHNDDMFVNSGAGAQNFFIAMIAIIGTITIIRTFLQWMGYDRRKTFKEVLDGLSTVDSIHIMQNGETKKTARVVSDHIIQDPNNQYKLSYAVIYEEIDRYDNNLKRYRMAISELNAEDADVKVVTSLLRRKYFSQFYNSHPINPKEEKPTLWNRLKEIAYEFRSWKKIKKFVFYDTLNFMFWMALVYWIMWAFVAGLVGVAATAGMISASPVIVFVPPVAIMVAYYAYNALVWYRRGMPKPVDSSVLSQFVNLIKIRLSDAKRGSDKLESLDVITQSRLDYEEKSRLVYELKSHPKLHEILGQDPVRENLKLIKSKNRIRFSTFQTFVFHFIVFAFSAWPLTDLLSVFGVSASALLASGSIVSAASIIVAPIVIALILAYFYSRDHYFKSIDKEGSDARQDSFNEETHKFNNPELEKLRVKLRELSIMVHLRRARLEDLSKELKNPIDVAELKKKLKNAVSVNNSSFMERLNLKESTPGQRFRRLIRKFFSRFSLLNDRVGLGGLIARILIGVFSGLAGLGLIPGFSMTLPIIIAFMVVCMIVFPCLGFIEFNNTRKFNRASVAMDQISSEIHVYTHENDVLRSEIKKAEGKISQAKEVVGADLSKGQPSENLVASPTAALPQAAVVPPALEVRKAGGSPSEGVKLDAVAQQPTAVTMGSKNMSGFFSGRNSPLPGDPEPLSASEFAARCCVG